MTTHPQTSFELGETPAVWRHVPIEHPPAREVYDRHYSRQTPGAEGLVAPGERFLLEHQGVNHKGELARAIWAVVYNRFRGRWYFRNSIFRNETTTLSSSLIREAVVATGELWIRRYHSLPAEQLRSEIDIDATRKRRSKRAMPGECYRRAGWEWGGIIPAGHGRTAKAVWRCPPWAFQKWW